MKLTKSILLCVYVFGLLILASCNSENSSVIYRSDNVKVSLLQESYEAVHTDYYWVTQTIESAYGENEVILTGTVSNVREAVVNYKFNGANASDNITLFDVTVNEVLHSRSETLVQEKAITVGTCYNTSSYTAELPIIKEGGSYLIFCNTVSDNEDDALERVGYMDYWISAPRHLLLEKTGNAYITSDFFQDVTDAVNAEKYLNSPETDRLLKADVISCLQKRSQNNSARLWELAEKCYLVDCKSLEEHIQNTAANYDN